MPFRSLLTNVNTYLYLVTLFLMGLRMRLCQWKDVAVALRGQSRQLTEISAELSRYIGFQSSINQLDYPIYRFFNRRLISSSIPINRFFNRRLISPSHWFSYAIETTPAYEDEPLSPIKIWFYVFTRSLYSQAVVFLVCLAPAHWGAYQVTLVP